MDDLVVAIGLVLVIEGIVYGAFPSLARRMAAQAVETPEQVLRVAGLAAIAAGVGLVWIIRG